MEKYLAPAPPLWPNNSGNLRRSGSVSSAAHPISNFRLLSLAASLAFTFFVFPSFLNLTSQIFQPRIVKRSWDSLILALVLFTIIACGFLSRSDHGGDNGSSGSYPRSDTQKSSFPNLTTPYGCDDNCYLRSENGFSSGSFGRTRSSGWYPDLHVQNSARAYGEDNEEDGSEHAVADDSCDHNAVVKEMEVPVTPPPPARPGARAARKKGEARTNQTIAHKPKKGRRKHRELGVPLACQPLPSSSHQLPPLPPLRPPPPVLQTRCAFKKGKTREALSALQLVPPPPAATPKTRAKPAAVTQSTINLITVKKSTPKYESSDDSINSGGLSPLISMPPPRPPFKLPPWRFDMRGRYVLIQSPIGCRHKSPDTEDDEESVWGAIESSSSEATSPAFCPTPEVNKRASKFIGTFRARLNQEKKNSTKQRRVWAER